MIRWLVLALLVLAAPVRAQDISRQDTTAIHAVIQEQLDAFQRDDGARAFSLATSGIQASFGSADRFMAMVRSSYPVVYRPHNVQFESVEIIDGRVFQPVRMTDDEGAAWLAIYPMQRQGEGVWRIDGCQLARLKGREI